METPELLTINSHFDYGHVRNFSGQLMTVHKSWQIYSTIHREASRKFQDFMVEALPLPPLMIISHSFQQRETHLIIDENTCRRESYDGNQRLQIYKL